MRLFKDKSLLISIVENLSDPFIITDEEGFIQQANPTVESMLRWDRNALLGKNISELMISNFSFASNTLEIARQSQESYPQALVKCHDGDKIAVSFTSSELYLDHKRYWISLLYPKKSHRLVNIPTRSREYDSALKEFLALAVLQDPLEVLLGKMLETLLNLTWLDLLPKAGIFLVDDEHSNYLHLSTHRNLSHSLQTLCAKIPLGHCICGRAAQSKQTIYAQHIDDRHDSTFEDTEPHGHYGVPIMKKGDLLGVLVIFLPDGSPWNKEQSQLFEKIAVIMAGMIDHKRAKGHLHLMAYRDPLTGLASRSLLEETTRYNFALAIRNHWDLYVLLLNLDDFKKINAQLGYEQGDQLLREVAKRLSSCVRPSDIVSRLKDDEFVIVIIQPITPEDVRKIAQRMIDATCQPILLSQEVILNASVGVASYPRQGDTLENVLQQADKARILSKQYGQNHYYVAT